MNRKPLIETNPYLKDAKTRQKLIARSVRTSSGVEGIQEKTGKILRFEIPHRKRKKIYKAANQ